MAERAGEETTGTDARTVADVGASALAKPAWTAAHASTLPASGAWRPSDPTGDRQFMRTVVDRDFVLEGGGQLRDITVAFETWGTLAPDGGNAVLVCHALTGDTHAAGPAGPGPPRRRAGGTSVIGPGKAIDTDRWFVVCVNVLGGCQGTTGPASPQPDRPGRYGSRFPVVTVRDMVRVQARLADALGIDRWAGVVGGSMGGMQVLEWGVMFPDRVGVARPHRHLPRRPPPSRSPTGAPAAGPSRSTRSGATATTTTPSRATGPHAGLALARMFSQITFRTDDVFTVQVRARLGRAAGRRLRAVAALPGRALPRAPRRQAGPPLRRQQLPAAHQGDGPARPRPGAGRRWPPRWPASQAPDAVDRRQLATCSTRPTSSASSRRGCVTTGSTPATPRSTAPTATTPSCSSTSRSASSSREFLDDRKVDRARDHASTSTRRLTNHREPATILAVRGGRAGATPSLAPVLWATLDLRHARRRRRPGRMATSVGAERFYSRYGNPTIADFERAVADLEGAEAARAYALGHGRRQRRDPRAVLDGRPHRRPAPALRRHPAAAPDGVSRASASTSPSSTAPSPARSPPRSGRARRCWCGPRRRPTPGSTSSTSRSSARSPGR